MVAYVIVLVDVKDRDRYREYMRASPGALAACGGKFAARGGETITLEGPVETRRTVLLEFPSLEQARWFYDSELYQQARKLREGAAEVQMIAVEGVPDA